MKKILLIIITLLFISCGKNIYWEYVYHGKVKDVKYISAGWGQEKITILYFDDYVHILKQHRIVLINQVIYLYKKKGHFSGHETIFNFKLENKTNGYYIYND